MSAGTLGPTCQQNPGDMNRTIYGLYTLDTAVPGGRNYFYVGISGDVVRRLREHRSLTDKGHEDKYAYMRQLKAAGIEVHTQALRDVPEGEYVPDSERWFVIKFIRDGHQLKNMRYGNAAKQRELAEQVQSPRIRRLEDVVRDRERRTFEASKRVRRRVLLATLRKGIPNVEAAKVLSPVMRGRLNFPIFPGTPLRELVLLARHYPKSCRMFNDFMVPALVGIHERKQAEAAARGEHVVPLNRQALVESLRREWPRRRS